MRMPQTGLMMLLNLLLVLVALAAVVTAVPLNDATIATAVNSTKPTAIHISPNLTAARLPAAGSLRPPNPRPNFDFFPDQLKIACMFNKGTRRCLDVEQSRKNDVFADAQMWRCNKNPVAQEFQIFGSHEWTHFSIRAQFAGGEYPYSYTYCLDVAEGKFFNGQAVRWWNCNWSDAQDWGYNPAYGHIYPKARPDLCLDPVGGIRGSFDGQGMQLWKCVKGEQGQNWDLAPWGSSTCSA